MKTHNLNTDADVFQAVLAGTKTFEIRLNDRGFEVGDKLRLQETLYSGEEMKAGAPLHEIGPPIAATITYILKGPRYGLAEGWVIMSIVVARCEGPFAAAGDQRITRLQDELRQWREQNGKLHAQVRSLTAERDAAVNQARIRDQKWMDGIDETVGQKLRYSPTGPNDFMDRRITLDQFIGRLRNTANTLAEVTSERDAALSELDKLTAERDEAVSAAIPVMGQRDALREGHHRLIAERDAALKRAEEAEKERDEAREHAPATMAKREQLAEMGLARDIERLRAEYEIIMVEKRRIPQNSRLIEAYESGKEIVVMGQPDSDDESHNCDAMGCGSLTHVLYRLLKSDDAIRLSLAASEAREAKLRGALNTAFAQLAVARRFLPSHGSFGEEGIAEYEAAQEAIRVVLQETTPAAVDTPPPST